MTLIKAEWRGCIFFIRLGKLRINPEKPGLVLYLTLNYEEEKSLGQEQRDQQCSALLWTRCEGKASASLGSVSV